jgi:hypothetical protein
MLLAIDIVQYRAMCRQEITLHWWCNVCAENGVMEATNQEMFTGDGNDSQVCIHTFIEMRVIN